MKRAVNFLTGTASDLGCELLRHILESGERVGVLGLVELGEFTEHQSCLFFPGDVRKERHIKRALRQLQETWGPLDAAFNLAEFCPEPQSLCSLDLLTWRECLDSNLKGTWLCLKHEIPLMKTSGASIVNLSSAQVGGGSAPGQAPFAASKLGITELTRSASREATWIRLNTLCPAPGTPVEQIVATARWLASPQASGVNGQAIEVGEDCRRA